MDRSLGAVIAVVAVTTRASAASPTESILAIQQAEIANLQKNSQQFSRLLGSLVAYYSLDRNDDGLENRGGVTSVINRSGADNKAAHFTDGACLLDNRGIENNKRLNTTGSFSVTAWIKPEKFTSGMIVAKHFTHLQRSWNLNMDSGRVHFAVIKTDDTYVEQFTTFPSDGKWHHVAAVYNKGLGQMTTYIDGVQATTAAVGSFDLMETSLPITVGCYLDSTDASTLRDSFNGTIDEVYIFSRPLTSEAVGLVMIAP